MPLLAVSFLVNSGIPLAIVCAFVGLGFALALIKSILASPAGNEKMREIAGAVQEGAKAYLGRQVRTVSVIAVVIAVLVAVFKDVPTALGFVLGAVCSLAAGFIGMRVAVVANVRTAQGAVTSRKKAMQAAFNGGAVTGLLVVALALLSTSVFWLVMRCCNPDKALSSLVGGRWVTYIDGAPASVNAGWASAYPTTIRGLTPLFTACG